LFSHTPQQMGLAPDGAGTDAPAASIVSATAKPLPRAALWRDVTFLTLALGMAFGLFVQVGLIAHLYSLLVPALGADGAGFAMGAATAAAIGGRTLVGWLMPVGADRRLVACASYVVQIAGSIALIVAAGSNVPLVLVGVLLFGAGKVPKPIRPYGPTGKCLHPQAQLDALMHACSSIVKVKSVGTSLHWSTKSMPLWILYLIPTLWSST